MLRRSVPSVEPGGQANLPIVKKMAFFYIFLDLPPAVGRTKDVVKAALSRRGVPYESKFSSAHQLHQLISSWHGFCFFRPWTGNPRLGRVTPMTGFCLAAVVLAGCGQMMPSCGIGPASISDQPVAAVFRPKRPCSRTGLCTWIWGWSMRCPITAFICRWRDWHCRS